MQFKNNFILGLQNIYVYICTYHLITRIFKLEFNDGLCWIFKDIINIGTILNWFNYYPLITCLIKQLKGLKKYSHPQRKISYVKKPKFSVEKNNYSLNLLSFLAIKIYS